MNVDSSEIYDRIKQKVQVLVVAYERAKQENEQLKAQKAELEKQLKAKEQAYVELEARYSRLKLAKALKVSEADAHEAKIKVNRIVREIDKCIAFLNK
jgi:cell division septum initiation protein DivIVA